MRLSKTDFIHYLHCSKSLWLLKKDPESYPDGEFSEFLAKLVREGFEVEEYFYKLLENNPEETVVKQQVFETDSGLHARLDGFSSNEEGFNTLYEVKSSTSMKPDNVKDACFQKICAERAGSQIDRVMLVHLNGSYVRDGEVDPSQLLTLRDITDDVLAIETETVAEVDQALAMLEIEEVDPHGCDCTYKTRANHCDTFQYFNPDVPKVSVYSLPRINKAKLSGFVNEGAFDLLDVDPNADLSEKQKLVLTAAQSGEAQIDVAGIREALMEYQYPLYFFDFETCASAIPMLDGLSPHKHFPVQYSLHILHEDGELEHKEFLQREEQLPFNLIEEMENHIGGTGSIVSWHASFEKTQNRNMAEWYPGKAAFLNDVNDRMVDLEDIFKEMYVDARFGGSSSIKKVLPVLCPELSYEGMAVNNGAAAMDAWIKMLSSSGSEQQQISKNLMKYCELDTFAMVGIYRFLRKLSGK